MSSSLLRRASGSRLQNRLCAFVLVFGQALVILPSSAQPAAGLFTPRASFDLTNHLVSVSVFQWFTANGGQLTGPWRPVEGRSNWTGTTNFWRAQIKQMMAANFDMLYVHLIPSSEQQRINLFQALNQLRREGWNVPKVAPFLDPMITWYQQPLVDVSTATGKEEFVSHYIRWFNQYYSVNQDAYADDYLARIDGRPVLDTWHVKFNLQNLAYLSRADVETRLQYAFAAAHPLFSNGIYMVTTALNDPTFAWTDEKVPQFEINEYFRGVQLRGVGAVQLKGGYWDQNIRNPGDFLARAGGIPYNNAWNQVNRTSYRRVYVESWNEYDEGTGIYAANPGPPYIRSGSGNSNTDVWSLANDPYEYIKTTARGAATFNDWPERDAKIIWHNIPTRMLPGATRTATVVVRNEGDALWSEATKYRFGQKEFLDPQLFGPGRYLINDNQDDIPTFGGIFRGRAKTFTLSVKAPMTPGVYTNHWSMLQENVTWFGEEISQEILVDPTVIYHGMSQAIDSTALFTNRVEDFTEHTYSTNNLPVGSFADCEITRTFAAPIKSIKVSIVSGTADDIGYAGPILVTPDSANTTCRLGNVVNEVDASPAVSVNGNRAGLTLRAQDTCCCGTGWGEDSGSERANARLHWQVELYPPVPTSAVFSNAANGHFYVLLSPATWSWSEHAAAELGGHLAALNDQAEQDWVFQTLATYGGVNRLLWIGLNDVAKEGAFRWSSGEPVSFTNWAPGEPNNALGGEDFVTMYQPGHTYAARWNDWGERVLDGSRPFNGVVELPASNGPLTIRRQPLDRRVYLSAKSIFSVIATSSRALQYQWHFNRTNLAGATNSTLTLTNVQYDQAGTYSVLVSDALASVLSSNATLIVNHPPVATAQTVSLDEDTSRLITLTGTDSDGDTLSSMVVFGPQHGQLSGNPPALTYTPDHDYFGPDSFAFRVFDGLATSDPAAISIHVVPVNDPPIAYSQSTATSEDTPLPITLTALDVDGNAFTWTIVQSPTHGTLSGTPPNLTYLPATNYFGPDGFTFKVNDDHVDSEVAAVNITIHPVNDVPYAVVEVSPLFAVAGGGTNLFILSPNNSNVVVLLDASKSWDVENDPLEFAWFEAGATKAFAGGVRTTNLLTVGSYVVTLVASDGQEAGTTTVAFEIIRPSRAVAQIYVLIEDADVAPRNKQPLYASLNAAILAFERGNFIAGTNILEAFISKVQAQIAPVDAVLADELIRAAREIIRTMQ